MFTKSQTTPHDCQRKDKLLNQKFKEYLLPTTFSALAVSLNEFVDGLIVSNLLGTNALAVVNIGMPIVLVYAMVYILVGSGGSILYSIACGKHQKNEANAIFTISLYSLFCISVAIGLLGALFSEPLVHFLSKEESLLPLLSAYIPVLFLSAPFFICVSGIGSFLVCDGNPKLAMYSQIVANVVNIILDVVFIRYCDMGIQGAAYATLCGYATAGLLILCVYRYQNTSLKFVQLDAIWARLKAIVERGLSPSFNQLGLAIKISLINLLASFYAGVNGLVAFSLCFQCLSIVSIFLFGLIETFNPLVGFLHGENDSTGIRFMLKRAVNYVCLITVPLTGVFFFFPELLASAYGVELPEQVAFCITAIRIFALSFLFRNFALLGMCYAQVTGMKKLAFAITLLDSLGVIPLAVVLGFAFGALGVFAAFPLTAAVTLIVVWYAVRHLARVQGKTAWMFFVLGTEPQAQYQATIQHRNKDAVQISSELMQFSEKHGLDKMITLRLGMAAEEMCVYTIENAGDKNQEIWMDIVVKIFSDHILMFFKSNGKPFSPLDWNGRTKNELSSLRMIQQLAQKIEYSVTFGLNCTLINIKR